MSGNRLLIAILVLVGLLGVTVLKWNQREAEDRRAPEVTAKLPKLKKDDITELSIAAPEKPAVTLKKVDNVWKLTAPLETGADKDAVDAALSKLEELEVVSVAATLKENHEPLEVTDKKGVHVVAKQADKVVADLLIGTYRSGNTMVREQGVDTVAATKGSVKYAFEKDLKDWRDKAIMDLTSEQVTAVTFKNKNGTFSFVKEGDAWKQAPGDKPIPGFESGKIVSLVGTATTAKAQNFAADTVTAEAAGIGPAPVGSVTLSGKTDAGEKQATINMGNKTEGGFYAQRAGKPTIYVVSEWSGDRMVPNTDKFVKDKDPAPQGAAAPGQAPGMNPGLAEALKKAGAHPVSPH